MRAVLLLAFIALFASPASAYMLWSETTQNGVPVTSWTRGANGNEVNAAARAAAGQPIRILETCRQPGWFAYVGADNQTQRGVSCGFETKEAAIFRARANCEIEDGRCDLERLGFDDATSLGTQSATELPINLPAGGSINGDMRPVTGPINAQ